MRRILGFLTFTFLSTMLFAEAVTCENDNGSCQFNEDGSYECLCSEDSYGDGMGVAGTGSDGDVIMPTQEECLETVNEMCALPEGAVTCENPAGECFVMEDGDYWCDCYDGSGTGDDDSEPGDPGEEPSVDSDEPVSEDNSPSVDGENETEPAEEKCENNSDCRDGFICMSGYCVEEGTEDPEKEECESALDCKAGYICMDGYCVDKDSEDPEEEAPECETLLKETCGTEAPDLNKICSEEALEFCADGTAIYFEKCEDEKIPAEMIEEIKNGTWNEIAPDVAECCNDFEYIEEEMATFIDCLKNNDCEECSEDFEEAVGEDYGDSGSQSGDDIGDTANEDDGTGGEGSQTSEDPKDSASDSSDGCSMTLI